MDHLWTIAYGTVWFGLGEILKIIVLAVVGSGVILGLGQLINKAHDALYQLLRTKKE